MRNMSSRRLQANSLRLTGPTGANDRDLSGSPVTRLDAWLALARVDRASRPADTESGSGVNRTERGVAAVDRPARGK